MSQRYNRGGGFSLRVSKQNATIAVACLVCGSHPNFTVPLTVPPAASNCDASLRADAGGAGGGGVAQRLRHQLGGAAPACHARRGGDHPLRGQGRP
eukprot:284732-Prorocentrum_minimum.AAC.1